MREVKEIQIITDVSGPGFVDIWDFFSKMSAGGAPRSKVIMIGYPYASDINHLVCIVPEGEKHYAELIVRAVNAHDRLCEAVQHALNMVDGDGQPPDWDELRAALKLARGDQ